MWILWLFERRLNPVSLLPYIYIYIYIYYNKITTFFNFKTCFDAANIIVSYKILEKPLGLQWNPDFSNPRFLESPDNSNQFFFPWDRLTLDNSNLRKLQNNLVWMSIASTSLNKLTLPDELFSHILITQQESRKSVISLKGTMTASDYRTKVPLLNCFSDAVAAIRR